MPDFNRTALTFIIAAALAVPLAAKESLGVFSGWAAFRDGAEQRCYAIAKPDPNENEGTIAAYASIGSWPGNGVRNQIHVRLSRETAQGAGITLRVGRQAFTLTGGGSDAWARDAAMDAAIVAAMRASDRMTVRSIGTNGRNFTDRYRLAGAATAIDAATLACAGRAR